MILLPAHLETTVVATQSTLFRKPMSEIGAAISLTSCRDGREETHDPARAATLPQLMLASPLSPQLEPLIVRE